MRDLSVRDAIERRLGDEAAAFRAVPPAGSRDRLHERLGSLTRRPVPRGRWFVALAAAASIAGLCYLLAPAEGERPRRVLSPTPPGLAHQPDPPPSAHLPVTTTAARALVRQTVTRSQQPLADSEELLERELLRLSADLGRVLQQAARSVSSPLQRLLRD